MTPPRTAGRPLAKVLTEEKIVTEARAQLAKNGRFTMSSLAKGLKVAPSSLYNHLTSRDEVLARISDAVVAEIDTSPLEQAAGQLTDSTTPEEKRNLWLTATRQWAHSYWKAFSSSVELTSTLAITPIANAPQTLAMYETVVKTFITFGWKQEEVLTVLEAIEAYLLGSALDASAPAEIFDPGTHSDSTPFLAGAYAKHRAGSTHPAETAFARGLQALLAGFAAELLAPAQQHIAK